MKFLFSVLFSFCGVSAWAQHNFQFEQKNDIKVVVGADTLRQPWVGGFNSPVFSTIKLNNDATEDLYVFDRHSNKSYTFLADNASGTWQWKYAPEYEALFPEDMEFWTLLRDFDNDGNKDLFTGDRFGTWLYENRTLAGGPLTLLAPRGLKFNLDPSMPLGSYVLPALTDADNDGDMDMLVFDDNTASTVYFYKNNSIELGYNNDSLKFS